MQVMFVDDESRVLSGIERALMMQNIEWECRFANSGQQALSMLEEQPADVVISDMRMPFMDGAELLSQIRTHWPGTIRVILSGYSDPDATERMLDVAHRFVSKPCDSNMLIGMVKNTLLLRDMLQDPAVVNIIGHASHLPTASNVFVEIDHLLAHSDRDTRHITRLLSSDPALSAKILQLANSTYFSRGSHITNIANAIGHLGLDHVKILILASQVFSDAKTDPHIAQLQQSALLASTLAAQISGHQSTAQVAALLANIAQLIPEIRQHHGLTATTRSNTTVNAAVSAYLLSLWGLPLDIVEAVAYHEQPSLITDTEFCVVGAVHVAVALANSTPLDMDYLEQTGMLSKQPLWQNMLAHIQECNHD
ncbi:MULTISPECIES: response regulator [unclassified Symbiopectobacterium]|uniref:response regulator n=1 Tax=unclassified Symbiopectobacterium TaxID=2794573 RepID=UPI0022262145|nr:MULTISPECIES: response regulator [unclassified Symbiopectobacterium]MCW2475656.1 HDOD domain-containing protein [Candidatus Symbiopectobacterium sp. NZEC151]MCW2482044.1 HDOD domain-containing protein [Candidatus Symbiopectobacterium sp. NZEC135]